MSFLSDTILKRLQLDEDKWAVGVSRNR